MVGAVYQVTGCGKFGARIQLQNIAVRASMSRRRGKQFRFSVQ
jgi:hypothetical protein